MPQVDSDDESTPTPVAAAAAPAPAQDKKAVSAAPAPAPAASSGASTGLVKPKEIDWKDTNVANIGSQADKDARKAAADKEPAWLNAGKASGIQVWRIEQFKVKDWDKTQYGAFFSGDSYIVLYTFTRPPSTKLEYHIHFWLGKDSSQDEMGSAAYKTVELDDYLLQQPVQYREVQGYETPEFLRLFNGSVRYMDGGVESGFNKVQPTVYQPRLFHVKGTGAQNVRVIQVPIKVSSLNDGDVFVVDAGLELFQWNGKTAGVWEKRKGGEVTRDINNERNGKAKIYVLDSGDDNATFWKLLGGKAPIPAAIPDPVDEKKSAPVSRGFARVAKPVSGGSQPEFMQIKLKKAAVAAPAPKQSAAPPAAPGMKKGPVADKAAVEAVYGPGEAVGSGTDGKLTKADLNTNDVFIFDSGNALYTWVGAKASSQDRRDAIAKGVEYLKVNNRPLHTPVIRVSEGNETPEFWAAFDSQ